MLPIKKIIYPTDFSEPSYKALKAANELAMYFSAELILVHVLSPIPLLPAAPEAPLTEGIASVLDDMEEIAEKSLMMISKEKISDGVTLRSVLSKGNPPDEIVKIADDEKADLIIIGTHGFTGWRHLILGSVAEKVVRLSSCPVLTIPAHEE